MTDNTIGDITVSTATLPAQTAQYTLILGTAQSDSVTLGNDLTAVNNLTMANGSLRWVEANGSVTAISSEIDFLITDDYSYLNLNTNRSATVEGFIMSARSRAVISSEWVEALQNGNLSITYDTILGDAESFDTVISGLGGQVILADYRYDENSGLVSVIGSYAGGAIIDFGLSA